MISVIEAQRILHDSLPSPERISVPIEQAFGLYLSEDIKAPDSSPRYTNSAMDGYAVRWEDCAEAAADAPVRLEIIGESQAGVPFDGVVGANSAVRISTGAMLPAGADTIIRVEDTEDLGGQVRIFAVKQQGQDVRHKGEEFTEGQLLFFKGDCLGARELALMAAVGLHTVPVYARPEVALLVTGTELVCYDEASIKPHQIRDSNTIMLASAIQESGGVVRATSHVQDSLEHTAEAIENGVADGVKLIVCSGGGLRWPARSCEGSSRAGRFQGALLADTSETGKTALCGSQGGDAYLWFTWKPGISLHVLQKFCPTCTG